MDLDGTLARTGPLKWRMWPALIRDARAVLEWPAAFERRRARRDLDLRARAVEDLSDQLGWPVERVHRKVSAAIEQRWSALYADAPRPPAVWALVREAQRRSLPVVVVSDYPASRKLDAMGVALPLQVDCMALGALKPFPDGILAAAALAGVPPAMVLHVGDRWDTDAGAAAACGARFLHIDAIPSPLPTGP